MRPGDTHHNKKLGQLTFGPATVPDAVPGDIDDQIPHIKGPRIVIVNGVVDASLSRLDKLPSGVKVVSLADAPAGLAAGMLDRKYDGPEDAYSIINRAHGAGGALLHIGARIDETLHIVDVVGSRCRTPTLLRLALPSRWRQEAQLPWSRPALEAATPLAVPTSAPRSRSPLTPASNHIILQDLPSAQIHLGRVDVTQAARQHPSLPTVQPRI